MNRLPAHAATVQRKLLQAAEEYRETMGCEPTTEELQALIGASETVVKATIHSGRGTISLQQPLSSSGEGDTIEDKVEDDRPGTDPFENVAEKQLLEITKRVISQLSPKEAAILRLRFGLVEDQTDSQSYPITEEEARMVMEGKGLK
jgi:RNA polymerase primary sigma factor